MMSTPKSRAPFPVTAWTRVLTLQSGTPEARMALEEICRAYWPAIYTYLRALGCEREEARDFTQDFLCGLIATEGL